MSAARTFGKAFLFDFVVQENARAAIKTQHFITARLEEIQEKEEERKKKMEKKRLAQEKEKKKLEEYTKRIMLQQAAEQEMVCTLQHCESCPRGPILSDKKICLVNETIRWMRSRNFVRESKMRMRMRLCLLMLLFLRLIEMD